MELRLVHLIVAARPNFMKVAPLYHRLAREDWCRVELVHTGQHYDANMSDAFFRDLALPGPAHHLEVGSGTHAEQTGRTMMAYERLCLEGRPAVIVVVGDVNATVACSLVGAKLCLPLVHLEAGLRSHDMRMPEEINRIVTDRIVNLLWTPSPDADANLLSEGVPAERIDRIGNIMIDAFEMMRNRIESSDTMDRLNPSKGPYAVVTLHRPSNVDSLEKLSELVSGLTRVAEEMLVIFPIHPRTRKQLQLFGLEANLMRHPRVRAIDPLGYVDFMSLVRGCTIAITDSGGIQEETTYLGIPCATLRENTERPITLKQGTNRLIQPHDIVRVAREALAGQWPRGSRPEYWDGHTAERAASSLRRFLQVDAAHAKPEVK